MHLQEVLRGRRTEKSSPLLEAAGLPDLPDTLSVLPRANHEAFADALSRQIQALPQDDADAERRAAAGIIILFLRDKKSPTPPGIYTASKALHDSLPSVHTSAAQNAIVRVSECFWADSRDSRELLVPNALTFLLQKSLAGEDANAPSASDVKRVYGFRDALEVGVKSWPEGTKALLRQTTMSALYMKVSEGQRFLARLLASSLDGVHSALLHMLPNVRKSRAIACGSVYVHAWKEMGTDAFSLFLEDVLKKAIQAGSEPLASNLRTILASFHANKRVNGMDEMLHFVYTPILFRALTVANPLVRRNAVIILADSFPVHDPSMSLVDLEAALDDQCQKVTMLLEDPVPLVRVAAIEGICRVLGLLWEIVPSATARRIVDTLSGTLLLDKSSANVRAAVCEGFRFMLDNHLTHPLLAAALPRFRNTLHDKVERVRIAFLDLLIELKTRRLAAARFFDIIPIHDLLLRLAIDSPAVSTRIMQLLVSSYFPLERKNKTRDEIAASQVRACLDILKQGEVVADRFYGALSMYIPPGPLVEFCLRLAAVAMEYSGNDTAVGQDTANAENIPPIQQRKPNMHSAATKSIHRVSQGPQPSRTKSRSGPATTNELANSEVLKPRLLSVIATVITSIAPSLKKPSNDDLKRCVADMFGGSSLKPLILRRGNTVSTRMSCLRIAANIPAQDVSPVVATWKQELDAVFVSLLRREIQNSKWFCELIYSGLTWGKVDMLIEVTSSWADVATSADGELFGRPKKRPRRLEHDDADGDDRHRRLAAVSSLGTVCEAIVENEEIRKLFLTLLAEEPPCPEIRSPKIAQERSTGSPGSPALCSDIVAIARRGILGAIDSFFEDDSASELRPQARATILAGLSSFMRLSVFVADAGSRRVTTEPTSENEISNQLCYFSQTMEWASRPELLSSCFAEGPDFALAFCNVVLTHSTDAAALSKFPSPIGSKWLFEFTRLAASKIKDIDASSLLQNQNAVVYFGLTAVKASYHILYIDSGAIRHDLTQQALPSTGSVLEQSLHGEKVFSAAADVLNAVSKLDDERREAVLACGAGRIGEVILSYCETGDRDAGLVGVVAALTDAICRSILAGDSIAEAPTFLSMVCISLVKLGTGRIVSRGSTHRAAQVVRLLLSGLVRHSKTAGALAVKEFSEFMFQECQGRPKNEWIINSLCNIVGEELNALEQRREDIADALHPALREARAKLAELRPAEDGIGVDAVALRPSGTRPSAGIHEE
jgi:hypothetical protein